MSMEPARSALISLRTRWLLVAALVVSIPLGVMFHARQARCAEVPHKFARRAPIRGASGSDTYVCRAMVTGLPVADGVVLAAWWLLALAFVRSLWIDRETRRRENVAFYLDGVEPVRKRRGWGRPG
jgi:ABC-type molybdate transport system permease subunit